MRKILKFILAKLHLSSEERYNEDWDPNSIIISLFSFSIKFFRALFLRVLFKKSAGLMLIGKNVKIHYKKYLSVGKNFIAEDNCEINCISKRGIKLGNKVTVGSFALIRPTNYYGGELGEGLTVGDNSNIGPYSYIGCSGHIEIGNNVMISPRVSIYSENHNFYRNDIPMKDQGVTRSFVKIEDDCWIASNSIILAGVTIGRGSVVAAGSVVSKDVPSYSVVAGVPAKVIRKRNE